MTTEYETARGRHVRDLLVQALLLVALLAAFFPGVFLRGELASAADLLYLSKPWSAHTPAGFAGPGNPIMPDMIAAMLPYYAVAKECIARGEWPLWNPYEMAGLPLLANCQSAVFYPPRLLHSFFDVHTATSVYYLLKLWLCGMTAFLCARGLGLSLFGARFLSILWAFNGFNYVWCYWPLPDVSAWLPVLFYGAEMAARLRLRQGIFGVAAGGALMILAGHPESAFTEALGVGIYFALRLVLAKTPPRDLLRAGGACIAGWALALGVTAVQWLPFLEYLVNSHTVEDRLGDEPGNYINAIGAVTFFVPRFLGTNAERTFWGENTFNLHSYYPGLIAWAGVFMALTLLRKHARRSMVAALLITAVLCVLWAFAVPGLIGVFALPGLRNLRLSYHIGFAVFALCWLATLGLEEWLRRPRVPAKWIALGLGAAAASLLVYAAYDFNADFLRMAKKDGFVLGQIAVSGGIALGTLAVLGVSAMLPRAHWRAGMVLATLAIDLFVSLHGMNPTVPRERIYPETPLIAKLRGLPQPARVQLGAGFVASGLMAPYGVEDWLGYDGLYPKRVLTFCERLSSKIWTAAEPICGIGWYLHDAEIYNRAKAAGQEITVRQFPVEDAAYFERVAAEDGLEIYRNKKALPLAYVSGAVKPMRDPDAIFQALQQPDFVPGAVVYTEAAPEGVLPNAPGLAGTAEVLSRTATHVKLRVHAERAGALVLSDAYYPGWRATVKGAATAIFPAYYAFRGVLVPAGDSDVEFTYAPRSFQIGLWISVVTLLVSLSIAWKFARN